MKNFTEQMADISELVSELSNEIKLMAAESDRKTQTILALRLEIVELKSNKNNES